MILKGVPHLGGSLPPWGPISTGQAYQYIAKDSKRSVLNKDNQADIKIPEPFPLRMLTELRDQTHTTDSSSLCSLTSGLNEQTGLFQK